LPGLERGVRAVWRGFIAGTPFAMRARTMQRQLFYVIFVLLSILTACGGSGMQPSSCQSSLGVAGKACGGTVARVGCTGDTVCVACSDGNREVARDEILPGKDALLVRAIDRRS
jgi:hypothetical protein